ncbi:catalase [Cellulophaga baltica]|uniref:catalase n=1 Tax=Cellulophaga TaxID=104264 RepID=UPI001C069F02|nr:MULTISPECIES: catalase [Cellulophaga]MBU2997790.1 catalase [Cellulophaga baltica]MDO6769186.1 catalase [Cellulophaga sp. 1_MG-2023]
MKKKLTTLIMLSIALVGFSQTSEVMTTNGGVPVGDNQNSKTVGEYGPVLLEDIHLIEKLAAFDRERIPERVVHARGAGAFGVFEASADMSQFTMAAPFQQVGKTTEIAIRFSTVVHGKGSPETARDPRGFAVKFYTDQGNYDIVGNNFPTFFIRDAIKFPDMVHAFKPSPVTNKQDPNRVFDFFSHLPEATHTLTLLYSDYGTPAGYQFMNGSSVHAFKWINNKGEMTYVMYHWESKQGQKNLTATEAEIQQGKDWQHATVSLRNAIDSKNYPQWDLYVQMIKPEDIHSFDFWPLDATKDWPADKIERIKIGTMTLNRNPINFFQEVESVAFAPGSLIPGVQASEDKLLQGRLFSYFDTQRHRLGPNFQQIEVNKPKQKVVNYNSDSYSSSRNDEFDNPDVNYQPSSRTGVSDTEQYKYVQETLKNVTITQQKITKTNDFGQAGDFYRSLTKKEQENLISNLAGDLAKVKDKNTQKTMITYFYKADRNYGMSLAKALGFSMKDFMN